MIGQTISHYRIVEKLGEGGMGVVYKAEDTKLRRTVALKFLRAEVLESAEHKERFLREAQAAAALDHPNICTVHEIDEAAGKTFLAMAFVEGQSVKDKIAERPLKLEEALDIAIQTAQGLQAAHEKGVVHRDIKPANLIVNQQGQVKVMDFGLAQLTDRTRLTQTSTLLGTPAYMSPEQAQRLPADHHADIWSLGVVFYEMVTGRAPFESNHEAAVLHAIIHEEHEPVTAVRAGLPPELDRIVAKAMAKKPEQRYQHADEMLVDLRALVGVGKQKRQSASFESAGRTPGRRFGLAAVVAAAVLIGLGLGYWLHALLSPATPAGPEWKISRITSDSGLSYQPAMSPDGSLIAFASDRAGENNLDIWVQQVRGGRPVRLTDYPVDEREPTFSPDGQTIAFRSDHGQGGIYVVPALGGDPQLIVPGAQLARFSPDGQRLVCATKVEDYPQQGEVYVVSRDGGNRRRVAADLRHASLPIWSPDGTALLLSAAHSEDVASAQRRHDWYVVRVDEGGVVKTGAVTILTARQLIPTEWYQFAPQAWSADGWVYFSAGENDSVNLWKLKITPKTWEAQGPPVRVTVGPGIDQRPSLSSGGSIVFSSTTRNTNLWSLPLEARSGKVLGSPAPLTRHPGVESFPYLTPDGSRLVYILESGAERSIQLLELRSGLQRSLTPGMANEGPIWPIPNKTGSRIAFSGRREDGYPLRVVPAAGGAVETVCPGVPVVMPWSWSWNGRFLAHRFSESPITIGVLDIESCERGEILAYSGGRVFQAEFSPDDQWIAFMGDPGVTVAPFERMGTIDPSRWIKVSDSGDKPRWAPDGNSLYFTSQDEGRLVIYRQALDPGSKTPIGEPSVIHRFDSGRFSFRDIIFQSRDISVSIDRIVFPMVELTGNVWLMEP